MAKSSGNGFVLPEINVPPTDLFSYTTLVYGEKGIGKTSLLAQFPNSLTFMFEARRRNLVIRQFWESEASPGRPMDWETFKHKKDQLCELGPDKTEVATVNIDSLDRSYQRCLEYICKQAGFEHPNDANDYGKTWDRIKTEYEMTMQDIGAAGYGVTFTSHAKQQHWKPPLGDAYDRQEPTCSGAALNVAKVLCDFVFYYGFFGPTRSFTIRGTQGVFASCGVESVFLDPKGRKLLTIDAGRSPEEAYQFLTDAYANKREGILWTPPESIMESFEYEESVKALEKTRKPTATKVPLTRKS